MGNGFKRFIDFSPLSVKNLNDQLEQLWLKVMGGISYRDLDSSTQTIIEGKTDEGDVISMIEQSKDEIFLAVGSTGGDNLVQNGNWQFGSESWTCTSASVSGDYMHIATGNLVQGGLRLEAGRTYTFGFEGYCNTPSKAGVYGTYTSGSTVVSLVQVDIPAGTVAQKYRVNFTVPSGIASGYVRIETSGSAYIKKIYVREGENVSEYTTNPNEISGSGLSITENAVNISTANFNLDLQDENGRVTSVLSTDGTGFDNMVCNNLTVINRKYVGDGVHIYVNSDSGSDSNSGLSTYYPFRTIARALKEVPLHIRGTCTVHLSGGTYNENVVFNYGGTGSVNIMGESAVLNGYIAFLGTSYDITIQDMSIFTESSYCVYGQGNNCFVELLRCVLDGNSIGLRMGIQLTKAFRMYINNCEINNCGYAIYCTRGSYLDIVNCKGDNNTFSVYVNDMAVVNAEGTVPFGDTITQELEGGRIDGFVLSGVVGTNYQNPRASVSSASFNATAKFTYTGSGMTSGVLRQGGGKGAFLVFNTSGIASTLAGRIIKSVKLVVKRRNDDSLAYDGILKAYSHNVASASGAFSYVDGYGDVCKISRGEEVSIDIPVSIIEKILAGTVKGVLFYDNSGSKEYSIELDNSFSSRLEVLYV